MLYGKQPSVTYKRFIKQYKLPLLPPCIHLTKNKKNKIYSITSIFYRNTHYIYIIVMNRQIFLDAICTEELL
ncbi:hypothetical protein F8172_25785 [Bacillus cereus]|uniref:Uncharacterized protein n=2 Tax=Bacillus cereus group TaxID=86661 RepID=A0A9W3YJA7_BACTU|nr:hypothetical protein D7J84_20975 [Bacillus thuringiensis]KAB2389158.1 hypothetical protein F8172_25785 [Bacillus cereus]MBG0973301.1 hypothetical protein [Bacillus sp. SRB3LM]OXB98124.1 hypothetical protein CGQ22_13770 [Bacillus sp. M13(2017)]KAB2402775.1 hypothetical protein F8170_26460 [Bacillus cereus]